MWDDPVDGLGPACVELVADHDAAIVAQVDEQVDEQVETALLW